MNPRVAFALVAAACAIVALLSAQNGTDYLYYYLPAAEYLVRHGLPTHLLPSHQDGPLAYPPAEYLLLAGTVLGGSLQGLLVRVLVAGKAALFVGLQHQLARRLGRPEPWLAVALLPSAVPTLFLENTDLSCVLAVQACVLLALDPRWRAPAVALVAYALGSKYTFLPVWAAIVAWFAVRRPREVPGLLVAAVPLALALGKNAFLYGDPVFPFGQRWLGDPRDAAILARWTGARFDGLWLAGVARGLTGSLALVGVVARPGRDRLLTGLVVGYVALWALALNLANAGDSGRFLLPVTVVVVAGLASASARQIGLGCALSALGFLATRPSAQGATCAAALGLWGAWHASGRPSLIPAVVAFAGLSATRLAARISLDPTDRGYELYEPVYAEIRAHLDAGEQVAVDFYPLPLDLWLDPRLIVVGSVLGNDRYVALLDAGSPCGVDRILVREGHEAEPPWSSPGFAYAPGPAFADFRWFEVRRPPSCGLR